MPFSTPCVHQNPPNEASGLGDQAASGISAKRWEMDQQFILRCIISYVLQFQNLYTNLKFFHQLGRDVTVFRYRNDVTSYFRPSRNFSSKRFAWYRILCTSLWAFLGPQLGHALMRSPGRSWQSVPVASNSLMCVDTSSSVLASHKTKTNRPTSSR